MNTFKTTLLTSAIILGVAVSAANAHPRGMMGGDRPSFAELDADQNGSLSAEELKAPMLERFAKIDTNADGGLSAEELAAEGAKRRAEKMLSRLDANQDGLIQFEEMGGKRGDLMSKIDSDDDGAISEEEFAAAAEKMDRRGKRHGDRDGRGHGDHDGKRMGRDKPAAEQGTQDQTQN